jgi:peptidoglycan/xylan/chitin deacetylase (PgdA/CDA1 family)
MMWLPPAVGLTAGGFMAWAVRGKSSSILAPSVWRGPRTRRAIALTFDDGPSESTPAILELLASNNAKATFFMCGKNAERLPGIARQVAEAGHEVGNHSYGHSRFDFRPPQYMSVDLQDAQEALAAASGITPRLFRAPYGVRWFGLGEVQKAMGLQGVMWSAIGLDWKLTAEKVSQRLESAASNGAIFCLHDGRETAANPDVSVTLEALRTLLPQLRKKGFELVTVSELLAQRA